MSRTSKVVKARFGDTATVSAVSTSYDTVYVDLAFCG